MTAIATAPQDREILIRFRQWTAANRADLAAPLIERPPAPAELGSNVSCGRGRCRCRLTAAEPAGGRSRYERRRCRQCRDRRYVLCR
jgi:hypothetical protein